MKKFLLVAFLLTLVAGTAFAVNKSIKSRRDAQIVAALTITTTTQTQESRDFCDPGLKDSMPYPMVNCPSPDCTVDIACYNRCLADYNHQIELLCSQACSDQTDAIDNAQRRQDQINAALADCQANHGTNCLETWTAARQQIQDDYQFDMNVIGQQFDYFAWTALRDAENSMKDCCIPPEPNRIRIR